MCCVCFLAPDTEIREALMEKSNVMPVTRASYPSRVVSSQHAFQVTSEQQVRLFLTHSLLHLAWESPFPGIFQWKMPVLVV